MDFAGQGFCQFLKHRFNCPPLAVTCRERLGARVPSRDSAQEVNFGIPITGRLLQGHWQASQGHRGPLGVREIDPLFVDCPGVDGASIGARADQSALQVPMLTHHKVATTRGNTPQKISRTKVAIRYPQVIWGDQGEDLAQQRPFLRVSVLAQDDLGGQQRLLFQHHQNLPRQWRRPRPAQLFQAMFTRREVISIENFRALSWY